MSMYIIGVTVPGRGHKVYGMEAGDIITAAVRARRMAAEDTGTDPYATQIFKAERAKPAETLMEEWT
jgi:hypothetical protein